jgi:hypothetical protein
LFTGSAGGLKPDGQNDYFKYGKRPSVNRCYIRRARQKFDAFPLSEVWKGNEYVVRLHAPSVCAGTLAASICVR